MNLVYPGKVILFLENKEFPSKQRVQILKFILMVLVLENFLESHIHVIIGLKNRVGDYMKILFCIRRRCERQGTKLILTSYLFVINCNNFSHIQLTLFAS